LIDKFSKIGRKYPIKLIPDWRMLINSYITIELTKNLNFIYKYIIGIFPRIMLNIVFMWKIVLYPGIY
jgi:hypothetical protein